MPSPDHPPPELTAAEDWVRDTWSLGGPWRRDQMDHHWNGPVGRGHRDTLQKHRPMLLQALVNQIKAALAATP